jgi:hypothetical protein
MQWREAAARGYEVQQRLLLVWRNAGVVCKDDEAIEPGEPARIEICQIVRVNRLDPFVTEHRLDLLEAVRRPVMSVVAEEQYAQASGRCGSGLER